MSEPHEIAVLRFFEGKPRELALYEAFAGKMLDAFPEATIRVQKTQISFPIGITLPLPRCRSAG